MLKRIWGYLTAMFRGAAEKAMNPEIEIEQAIQESRKQDQNLRNQAAKVIAHRAQIERKIEKTADTVGEVREMAKKALLRAEDARNGGNTEGVEKWTRAAQSLALKLQAAENNLNGLKDQYEIAVGQSDAAKSAVEQNAMRLQELAARRMELLGRLEQAKMQEAVNRAVESMGSALDFEAPSLDRVEEKIEERVANAQANVELRESTPEGAEAELREAISLAGADSKLEELRAELGLEN
jgi:phage shock protein A